MSRTDRGATRKGADRSNERHSRARRAALNRQLKRLFRRDYEHALTECFLAPELPWTEEYVRKHAAFVSAMLDTPKVLELFALGLRLPPSYGVGFDERVIEYPWLLAQRPTGRVLDAGSTLNHAHILDRILPLVDSLDIVTLVPEPTFSRREISYVYGDLRDLPFQSDRYDTVVSLSTLEHVGMDNARFGAPGPRAEDPRAERRGAIGELRRVLRPDGRFLGTVPYGRFEDHGWFQQLDANSINDLLEPLGARESAVSVYAYHRSGWERSSIPSAAQARYHDFTVTGQAAEDRAPAARAVACIAASV